MAWVVLVVSGMFEAVWATALGRSQGLTKPAETITFVVALLISMAGLGWAMRTLPTGTSYTVWVGIGAGLTVVIAVVTGAESLTVMKGLCLALILGGVVGLKLAG